MGNIFEISIPLVIIGVVLFGGLAHQTPNNSAELACPVYPIVEIKND